MPILASFKGFVMMRFRDLRIFRILKEIQEDLAIIKQQNRVALSQLVIIREMEAKEMAIDADILAEAERGVTVGESVLALVQKLVDNSGGNMANLQAALDKMKTENDKIEAAVLANTPQEPPTE